MIIIVLLFINFLQAEVRCMSGLESIAIEEELGKSMGGVQIDKFEAVAKTVRPRLLRFPQNAAGMAPYLQTLQSSFQIYKIAEQEDDVTRHALRVGHRDNPYGRPLIPLCSGSFTGPTEFTTATHCLRSKNESVESIHILRRHHFELVNGRIRSAGYTDVRIQEGSIQRRGDFVRARVVGEVPGPYMNPANERSLGDDQLLSVGYPSNAHGRPVITIGCGRPTYLASGELTSTCPVLGGMSGGPVLSAAGGQVGTVSLSSEDDLLTFPGVFER